MAISAALEARPVPHLICSPGDVRALALVGCRASFGRLFVCRFALRWVLDLGRQRGQGRHVGRCLRRRPRTGQCSDVDGDDPGHQNKPC
jgi:hypothetical protein